MNKPLVLIGAGGHASVLCDILLSQGHQIVGVISTDPISSREMFVNVPHFYGDDQINQFDPDEVDLINGIGPQPNSSVREIIVQKYESYGFGFTSVISNKSIISSSATLDVGVQILHTSVVQVGAKVGAHTVVNTGAIVEHDCCIGEFSHLAPNAITCGGVIVGPQVFIGANATIFPGINVGRAAVVSAGAVVNDNVSASATVYSAKSNCQNRVDAIRTNDDY